MNNKLLLTLIFLLISLNLFSQESAPTNEELLKKIEKIEAELEKIKIEATDNNPMQIGDTLDWGTGLSLGLIYGVPTNVGMDIMYSIRLSSKDKNGYYLSPTNSRIIGFGIQGKQYSVGDLYLDGHEEVLIAYGVGPKISISSPVLLNFLGASSYISPFILFAESEQDSGFSQIDFGIDIGFEVNFWMSEKFNIYIGLSCDPSLVNIKGDGSLTNPLDYSMTFGINTFFKQKTKKDS